MKRLWLAMLAAVLLGGCRSVPRNGDAEAYPLPGVIDPVTERPVSHVLP